MVAPERARRAWWTGRTLRLVVLGVVLLGVSVTLSGGERVLGLAVGALCLGVAATVVVLGRRDRL